MLKKMIFATCFCVLLCMIITQSGALQKKQKEPEYKGPKINRKLLGKAYVPDKDTKFPKHLSDWGSFNSDEKIESVRLYGFDEYNSNSPIDITTKDPVVLETVLSGLGSGFRPIISDIDGPNYSAGSGAYLGVMQITTNKGELIIGTSKVSFYMGVCFGTGRQSFHSRSLAKQVDELVHKKTGKHLTKKDLKGMSGEYLLAADKLVYDDARKKKVKDDKNQKK